MQAFTFLSAKGRYPRRDILATLFAVSAAACLVIWALSLVIVFLVFSHQSEETHTLAVRATAGIPVVLASENLFAMLLGSGRLRTYNSCRVLQPALMAAALMTLWILNLLTPALAIAALYGSQAVTALVAALLLLKAFGLGRYRPSIWRHAFSFGLRQHGSNLAMMLSKGLDIMLMPLFGIGAVQIGIYSVAANIGFALLSVLTSVSLAIFPRAASLDEGRSAELIGKSLRLVLSGGFLLALLGYWVAPTFLRMLYGPEFASAFRPLVILLPAVVFLAAGSVASAGLQASNLPLQATVGQLGGFAVTVVGLVAFLAKAGILAAAWVSLIAYAFTFGALVALLANYTRFDARRELGLSAFLNDISRWRKGKSQVDTDSFAQEVSPS